MINTARMADLIDVDVESHLVTVGPGMTGPELERLLAPRGLTMGHYPQSWQRATIGSYVATRSAGQASSGTAAATRWSSHCGSSRRSGRGTSAGRLPVLPDPTCARLIVGSEGAFGVITQVTCGCAHCPGAVLHGGHLPGLRVGFGRLPRPGA